MKTIKAEVTEQTILATTISINDEEAMQFAMYRNFTGYDLKDALRNANKRLNQFGFVVEM